MIAVPSKVLAVVVALAALAAIATPAAWAGTYEVEVCSRFAAGDGLAFAEGPNSLGFESETSCGNPDRFGGSLNIHADNQTNTRGGAIWTLTAPAETAIRSLEATRLAVSSWAPRTLVWEVKNGGGTLLDSVAAPSAETGVKYAVSSTTLTIGMRCTRNACQTGDSGPSVSLNGLVATMEETSPPTASVLATQQLAGPVRGTVAIPFRATDIGAGVRLSALIVDGQMAASAEDANGGRCVAPFRFLAPCKLLLESSLPLDTTRLKNGAHLVHVVVVDAAGLEARSANLLLTVDNPPPTVDPPQPPGPPLPMPPAKQAPALSGVSLSRQSFGASKRALLRFTSSEPGTLSVAISPARPKTARPLTTLTRTVAAGPGSVPIRTRVRRRSLRPGPYRLTATLRTADGRSSAPATLRFRVLPR